MQIVDLAYRGKIRENQMRKLSEENGNITYNILKLKSASHLGLKLLNENSKMQFADQSDIVHVQAPKQLIARNQVQEDAKTDKKTNSLLSLLSFGALAEARFQE